MVKLRDRGIDLGGGRAADGFDLVPILALHRKARRRCKSENV